MTRDRWKRAYGLQIAGFGLVLGTCLGAPAKVLASGFDNIQVGNAASGPITADAAAVHHNPGQLGYLQRPELSISGGVIFGAISYQRQRRGQYQYTDNFDFSEPIDPGDINPNKTGTAQKVTSNPVGPNLAVFYAMPVLPERLALGVGLYVPYAAIVDGPPQGPQRFANQSISLVSASATLSAAVRLHDVISIGAGVSYVFSTLSLSKVQDFGAIDTFGDGLAQDPIGQANVFGANAPSTVRELDVLARQVDIEGAISHGVTFNAGVALRPTDKLNLGLVYQHGSRLRLRGKFRLNMDDDFFTQDLASQGLSFPKVVRGDATVQMRLPKRVTAAAGYQLAKRFRLDAMASWAFYNSFDTVQIRLASDDLAQPALGLGGTVDQPLARDWVGTLLVEFTGRIQATDKLAITTLAGYHMPASPDSTIDLASPDGHRMIFGAGMGYTFSDRFALFTDVEGQAIVPRTVTASDFDLGNGEYRMFIGYLGVSGQFKFGRAPGARGARDPSPPAAPGPDSSPEGEFLDPPRDPAPSQTRPEGPAGVPPPPPPVPAD